MFIVHYDHTVINCSNDQMDELVYNTKTLFKIYGRRILEADILIALFENDDIYYSAKYLFSSKKSLKELYPRYCSLAKLIYLYYTDNVYRTELDQIVSNMCIKRYPSLDSVYTEYY